LLEFWNLLMATVEILLYKLADFYNWLYSATGLKQWQFLIIALAVILLLTLIARVQRKRMVTKVHTVPAVNRSEIIGINLSGHKAREHGTKETLKHNVSLTSEMDEKQMGWAQTTKEWRKLNEQIRQLEHEVTKRKRTEEHLKHQITELTTTNQELQNQITEHEQAEKPPRPQIDEAAMSEQQIPHEIPGKQSIDESPQPDVLQTPTQQEISQPEQADQNTQQEVAESAVIMDEQLQSDINEEEKVPKDTNQQTIESTDTEQSLTEEIEESEELRQRTPLNVQELKAIADLAKRLRGNNRQ
jgi:hypothetical protein